MPKYVLLSHQWRFASWIFAAIVLLLFSGPLFAQASAEAAPPPGTRLPEVYNREQFQNLRIYQVMVEAFIDGDSTRNFNVGYGPSAHRGDLRGVIAALPYIKALGMNAVWLTPIFDVGFAEQPDKRLAATGYYPYDYFRIDPHLGTMADARELVQTAHRLGLYVFFDGVFGHHCGRAAPSPSGRLPVSEGQRVLYPQSLEFYKEVALYWIDELEIDGWRLDQAYQVPLECWRELREAVEARGRERRAAGKKWGVLGYLVAEVWRDEQTIARTAYGSEAEPALFSAFDFPLRYRLVQTLAVQEDGKGRFPAENLEQGYRTRALYPSRALPNLMLTNHDLVRFGDLIQRAGLGGPETGGYWKRHRAALSFLAAHTGPITLYYGDEYGAEVPGFALQVAERCWEIDRCDDHVSRTTGKISGFNEAEQQLIDYTARLMRLRAAHPALWAGQRLHLYSDAHLYVDLKQGDRERIVYVLNVSGAPVVLPGALFPGDAREATDLLSGRRYRISASGQTISVPPLSPLFLLIKP